MLIVEKIYLYCEFITCSQLITVQGMHDLKYHTVPHQKLQRLCVNRK